MEASFPAAPLALGVVVSCFLCIWRTENPASIPVLSFLLRALPGIGAYMLLWWAVSYLAAKFAFSAVLPNAPGLGKGYAASICSFLLGLLVPQVVLLKDHFFSRSLAKKARWLVGPVTWIDEVTRLYLAKMISREERRINSEFFHDAGKEDRDKAVHRVFELHNVEIARKTKQKSPNLPSDRVLGILRLRNKDVKFKLLLHHLGLPHCIPLLRSVARKLTSLYPDWPTDKGDRREASLEKTNQRRKYEQEYVRAYILGEAALPD